LHSKGEYDKAVEYYTRALDIEVEVLGAHPSTVVSCSNVSGVLLELRQYPAAADCVLLCLHMLVCNPALQPLLSQYMKDRAPGTRLDVVVQQQRWSDALPLLPSLDRVGCALLAEGADVSLYFAAAAEVYRRCDMPSRAAAAMRRAASALRLLGGLVLRRQCFQNAGLCCEPAKLEAQAESLERLSASRQAAENAVPPLPDRPPAMRKLPFPVRARRLSCSFVA
jgi:hypothetical protein